jgi:hypothetical protein
VGGSNVSCEGSVAACGLGHVAASREPHVTALLGVLDEQPQRLDASGTAGEERVAAQVEQAAVPAHAVQLPPPHLQHLGRCLDDGADVGLGEEGVLLPVVQARVHR